MANTAVITDAIIAQGMLPLFYNSDGGVSVEVLRALFQAGVKAVEYTNRGEAARENFKQLVAVRDNEMPGLFLGIGTIKNMTEARDYMSIGADFLVSPGYVQDIAQYAVVNQIFYAPGCMTPSEIIAAENTGITFIKLFPGNLLGPEFMTTIKDVFPKLKFMPTGGVDTTRENLEAWFESGVCAVGMGSKLVSKKLMEQRNYVAISEATRGVLSTIGEIRKHGK